MPLQPRLVSEAQARINRASNTPGSGAEQIAAHVVGQVVGQMNQTKKAGQVLLDLDQEHAEGVARLADEMAAASWSASRAPGPGVLR